MFVVNAFAGMFNLWLCSTNFSNVRFGKEMSTRFLLNSEKNSILNENHLEVNSPKPFEEIFDRLTIFMTLRSVCTKPDYS